MQMSQLKQLIDNRANRQLLQRLAVVTVKHVGQIFMQSGKIGIVAHRVQAQQSVDHAGDVPAGDPDKQVRDGIDGRLIQASDDAEINDAQATVGQDK